MKKITLSLFMFVLFNMSFGQKGAQPTHFGKTISPEKISPEGYIKCITDEYEEYLQKNDPKRKSNAEFEAWIEGKMIEYQNLQAVSSESGGIIYIPVVVHVIHNGDAYGTNENITDEQVASQITVMNQDFRRMLGTPGYNTSPVGADIQIEFVLAKVDPNGNPTNGINRVNLCQASWETNQINSIVKPATSWNPDDYMNMWSVNFTDAGLLGYAQFPDASGLPGLNAVGGAANTDGVVAGYRFFGSSALAAGSYSPPFDRGRTMTHEVGHYLGLRHIWGDGPCGTDDFCADTPESDNPNYGCPTTHVSCGTTDMVRNYMDYTDDTCMNIFTQNQKTRILTVMNFSPRRASLRTSTKDIAIPLFANDAEVKLENLCATISCGNEAPAKQVILYNRGTSPLTSATLNYSFNGGAVNSFNWVGVLSQGQYTIITLPANSIGNGLFTVEIASSNGGADQRASNNSATFLYGFENFEYTNFTFNLQPDDYGSETTWTLTNSGGTTLYSGGPYTDGVTTLITQNWTLPADGCYTFTINDVFGDGICCDWGIGYYEVTANGGSTTVISGGAFGDDETKRFTNNVLSSGNFETLKNVFLYPNPTKNTLNLEIPNTISLDGSYEIHNAIGQLIESRKISTQNDLSIDVSNLSNGVYMINLNLEGQNKVLKFIKE